MTAGHLDIRGVSKRYGTLRVIDNLSLSIGAGEIVSLLGPSGCGKTTLLRLIAGLAEADGGTIALGGRPLDGRPPHHRNVGVVFQNYALFPHLSVSENVGFSLAARGMERAARAHVVTEKLALVRMTDFADRSVRALSGGQQQRVAVARALAMQPDLLLFDEPFSALDRQLREAMQVELKRLLRAIKVSAVFVTHDQDEALLLSDRIAVMNGGVIEQYDAPQSIYAAPATAFVLGFVGLSTRLHGRVTESAGGITTADTAIGPIRGRGSFLRGAPVVLGVRPECVRVGDASSDYRTNQVRLPVAEVSFKGARVLIRLDVAAPDEVVAEAESGSAAHHRPGGEVALAWDVDRTIVLPAQPSTAAGRPGGA